MAKIKAKEEVKEVRKKYPNKTRRKQEFVGRPREHDRDQIAKDIIEWASKETSINFCDFCSSYKPPFSHRKIPLWCSECDSFRESYEIAQDYLGARREKMLSADILHVKAYDLNATTYDYFLRSERQRIAEFEHALNLEKEAQVGDGIADAYAKTINQLERIQGVGSSGKSTLKIDKSKKSKDK